MCASLVLGCYSKSLSPLAQYKNLSPLALPSAQIGLPRNRVRVAFVVCEIECSPWGLPRFLWCCERLRFCENRNGKGARESSFLDWRLLRTATARSLLFLDTPFAFVVYQELL